MDPFRSLTLRLLMPADARTPADRPRDYSSVIYACRIVRRRLRDDLGFAALLDRLAGDLHLRAATTQEAAHYRVAFAAAPASHVQLHAALAATTQEATRYRVALAAAPASDVQLSAALAATTQEAA
jgi:hypothetical protein